MAVAFDTPVSAIEGIGPSIENLLRPKGVHTVYDLLRAPSPALHEVVADVASLQQVRSWRQMASLLEVATMTPQWAEALVKARTTSISELRRRHLTEVRSMFAEAREAHSIKTFPPTTKSPRCSPTPPCLTSPGRSPARSPTGGADPLRACG